MLLGNLKHVASFVVGSVALSDGVESANLCTFTAQERGKYFFIIDGALSFTVTAASLVRGALNIWKNADSVNSHENHWDSGGGTTGDIRTYMAKSFYSNLIIGDAVAVSAIITKRGGTITAYNAYDIKMNVYRID